MNNVSSQTVFVMAKSSGLPTLEPDNMKSHSNSSYTFLTYKDILALNRFLKFSKREVRELLLTKNKLMELQTFLVKLPNWSSYIGWGSTYVVVMPS